MSKFIEFNTVNQYNEYNNTETLHPLVSVVDYSKLPMRNRFSARFGLYAVMLKDLKCGELRYGRQYYDYQEGTMVFISPGQEVSIENENEMYQPKGFALVFHPDFIRGTNLGKSIDQYHFFSYSVNEAVHLSERERQIVLDFYGKIQYELQHAIDKHSKKLIISTIELFLDYCTRFYDRQFITRDEVNKGILGRFEKLLSDYFNSDKPLHDGLPSVSYFAAQMNLSPNYFGDLVRKETGRSAQEFIQSRIIDLAKDRMHDPSKSVSQVAYELGFKYPQHFTRLFRQKVGKSPAEYRAAG